MLKVAFKRLFTCGTKQAISVDPPWGKLRSSFKSFDLSVFQ